MSNSDWFVVTHERFALPIADWESTVLLLDQCAKWWEVWFYDEHRPKHRHKKWRAISSRKSRCPRQDGVGTVCGLPTRKNLRIPPHILRGCCNHNNARKNTVMLSFVWISIDFWFCLGKLVGEENTDLRQNIISLVRSPFEIFWLCVRERVPCDFFSYHNNFCDTCDCFVHNNLPRKIIIFVSWLRFTFCPSFVRVFVPEKKDKAKTAVLPAVSVWVRPCLVCFLSEHRKECGFLLVR